MTIAFAAHIDDKRTYLFPCLFSHHHVLFHDQWDTILKNHEQNGDYEVILTTAFGREDQLRISPSWS